MGDGMPAFMTALSKELEPLGAEYQPIILPIAHGKSYGEDQIMGPWPPGSRIRIMPSANASPGYCVTATSTSC
jgi:hypothetical protein